MNPQHNPLAIFTTAEALLEAFNAGTPVLSLVMAPDTFPMIEKQIQRAAFEYLARMLATPRPARPSGPEFDLYISSITQSCECSDLMTPLAIEHAAWLAVNFAYGNGNAALIDKAVDRDEGERVIAVRSPTIATSCEAISIEPRPMSSPPKTFTVDSALQVVDAILAIAYPATTPRHKVGVLVPLLVLEVLRENIERRRPILELVPSGELSAQEKAREFLRGERDGDPLDIIRSLLREDAR